MNYQVHYTEQFPNGDTVEFSIVVKESIQFDWRDAIKRMRKEAEYLYVRVTCDGLNVVEWSVTDGC